MGKIEETVFVWEKSWLTILQGPSRVEEKKKMGALSKKENRFGVPRHLKLYWKEKRTVFAMAGPKKGNLRVNGSIAVGGCP